MSVILRLQHLPWTANALDIRQFFHGLQIPDGGVHIVGGENGDAFIAFSTDEDARKAMQMDGNKLNDQAVRLLLSSKNEMQSVIAIARGALMASTEAPKAEPPRQSTYDARPAFGQPSAPAGTGVPAGYNAPSRELQMQPPGREGAHGGRPPYGQPDIPRDGLPGISHGHDAPPYRDFPPARRDREDFREDPHVRRGDMPPSRDFPPSMNREEPHGRELPPPPHHQSRGDGGFQREPPPHGDRGREPPPSWQQELPPHLREHVRMGPGSEFDNHPPHDARRREEPHGLPRGPAPAAPGPPRPGGPPSSYGRGPPTSMTGGPPANTEPHFSDMRSHRMAPDHEPPPQGHPHKGGLPPHEDFHMRHPGASSRHPPEGHGPVRGGGGGGGPWDRRQEEPGHMRGRESPPRRNPDFPPALGGPHGRPYDMRENEPQPGSSREPLGAHRTENYPPKPGLLPTPTSGPHFSQSGPDGPPGHAGFKEGSPRDSPGRMGLGREPQLRPEFPPGDHPLGGHDRNNQLAFGNNPPGDIHRGPPSFHPEARNGAPGQSMPEWRDRSPLRYDDHTERLRERDRRDSPLLSERGERGRGLPPRRKEDAMFGGEKSSGEKDIFVYVTNMPRTVTFSEVRRFFAGSEIPSDGIKLINDRHGNRIGSAFIRFVKERDTHQALMLDGEFMHERKVRICRTSERDFREALDSYVPQGDRLRSPGRGRSPSDRSDRRGRHRSPLHKRSRKSPSRDKEHRDGRDRSRHRMEIDDNCILIHSFPVKATREDLKAFFKPLRLSRKVFVEHDKDSKLGVCYIEFSSNRDFKDALKYHKRSLCDQNVDIYPISKDDLKRIINQLKTTAGSNKILKDLCDSESSSGSSRSKKDGETSKGEKAGKGAEGEKMLGGHHGGGGGGGGEAHREVRKEEMGREEGLLRHDLPRHDLRPHPQQQPEPWGKEEARHDMHPQPMEMMQEEMMEQQEEGLKCVRIDGLPFSANFKMVQDFFRGCKIAWQGIHIVHDGQGKAVGHAFIEFVTVEDAERAMLRDKQYMGKRYIDVMPITRDEMLREIENSDTAQIGVHKDTIGMSRPQRAPPGHHPQGPGGLRGPRGPPGHPPGMRGPHPHPPHGPHPPRPRGPMPRHMRAPAPPDGRFPPRGPHPGPRGFIVGGRNFPFQATEAEIMEFFSDFRPIPGSYKPLLHDGKPTGKASVAFRDQESAEAAMAALNNTNFHGRPVSLYPM